MMKKYKKSTILSLIILSAFTVLIFWQFFFKGLVPFPGNYMIAWYEPWKTSNFTNNTITISHKPVADDTFRQLLPYKILAMDIFKKIEFPLWNPYNGAGMPFMAVMHPGFLTPFNLLFLLLPSYFAWGIYIIIQPIIIGFFTYLYCRKIGLSFVSSIFSTVSFILSGFVITRLIFGEYIYTFSMLPFILYLLESFIVNHNTWKVFLLPFCIFFLFISGQPQIIFYILIFSVLYFVYRIYNYKKAKKTAVKQIIFIVFMYTIGIGLGAIQIIPTLELFTNAAIGLNSSKFIFDRFLLPISHLITIIIPNYFGNQATYNYWGAGDYVETIASIGTVPFFFASVGIFCKNTFNKDFKIFYLCSVIATILLSINWFGSRFVYSLPVPILSTGNPARIFSLTTFSLAILAGYGFENWINKEKNTNFLFRKVIYYTCGLSAILIFSALLYFLKTPCQNHYILNCRLIAIRNSLIEFFIFAVCVSALLFYLYKNSVVSKIIPYFIIFIISMIGIYNSSKFMPFSPKENVMPNNYLISILQEKTGYDRVIGIGSANIKTDFATFYKFYDPNYYDPLYNKRYGQLVNYANKGIINNNLPRSDVEITNDTKTGNDTEYRRQRLLNILGVKYLIFNKSEIPFEKQSHVLWQDNKWYIKINLEALPRIYTAADIRVINNPDKILKKLFSHDFNPKTTVILEQKPILPIINSVENKKNTAKINNYQENKISISVNNESNNLLVLSDNFYPGWKAFIDGKETKIYRANYTFRAIEVPKGNHNVEFIYQPESLKLGIIISIISSLLLILGFLYRKTVFNLIT